MWSMHVESGSDGDVGTQGHRDTGVTEKEEFCEQPVCLCSESSAIKRMVGL